MKTYLISDTHFNHTRLCELAGRPADFNEQIIKNWQAIVKDDDMVIHLGDVIVGRNGELKSIMEQLPGRKILVRGNHDHEKHLWYLERGFTVSCDGIILHDILFTHEPAEQLPDRVSWNVHGHLHNNDHRMEDGKPLQHFHKLFVLEHHYKPIELNEFLTLTWDRTNKIYTS